MNTRRNVLVIGATGNQGGAVAKMLLAHGHSVTAFTRNKSSDKAKKLAAQGVSIVEGNLTQQRELEMAMSKVDTVFAVTTPYEAGPAAELEQGQMIAHAAKVANVGHLVFSSVANADKETGIPHFDSKFQIEQTIQSLDIPYSILAPVFFMENHLAPWSIPALKEGTLSMPLPKNKPLQQISVQNIGEFAVALIERRESVFGERVDIAGEELTGLGTAAALSKAIGQEVVYEGIDPAYTREQNEDLYLMFKWFDEVGYSADISALRREYPEVNWETVEQWSQTIPWNAVL